MRGRCLRECGASLSMSQCYRRKSHFQFKSEEACVFVSEPVKMCLDAMRRMVRAGEPADRFLVAQHPVEHAVSLLHKTANDNGKVLPRATGFPLLPASLQSKALQVHLLKQRQESSCLYKQELLMSWALQIYFCIVTDGRLCFPDENLVSTLSPKRADAASCTIPLSC